MSISDEYTVSFTPFSERHYCKDYKKKYKHAWDTTRVSLETSFAMFDMLLARNIATIITDRQGVMICKTEFRVAGTNQSRRGSGNRCIVAVYAGERRVVVLLVYHKKHLPGSGSETSAWKALVREHYPEYTDFL